MTRCGDAFKNTKRKFVEVVKNYNAGGKQKLTSDQKLHFIELRDFWKNASESTHPKMFWDIKDHHHYVNGSQFSMNNGDCWRNYIEACMKLRLEIHALQ